DDRAVHQREQRLWDRGGQGAQAGALAPDEDERLHQGRPIPSYVSPAARTATGSRALRPSTTSEPPIASAARLQSSPTSSGHSVTRTAASAPARASRAVCENSTPGMSSRARSSATGPYACT